MKKLLVLLTVTLAMSLFMSSCKDDEPTGPSDVVLGEMSATIDGSSWKAQNALYYNITDHVAGVYAPDPLKIPTKTTTITVKLAQLGGEPTVGKHTALCTYQESEGFPPNSVTKTWSATNGSCEITEVTDKEIKGTFSFTGTNEDDNTTKSVNGKFYTPRQ